MFYLHNTLLNVIKDKKYTELFEEAQPNMAAYLQKAGGSTSNDVETCLTALYGLLVLRLKKADISEETEKAMETFSRLMAYLSQKYKAMKKGEMNFNLN
jgi:flagellin-specific chaperone FliS